MIDKDLKKILDEQQGSIIEDSSKYLCVSACPGAGKTYTLVKKIEKELESLKEYQGVIACSFTKEAAKEIKDRLEKINNKLDNCFIGTIDSLIMSLIIKPFLNRYLFYAKVIDKRISIDSVIIDTCKDLNNYTRFYDTNPYIRNNANIYINLWFDDLKKGIYKISFVPYILAEKIIGMELFNKYFSLRFPTIYIDEAQDLNYFQHRFLNALKIKTNINIVLFGDPNQSIYQFRGARPEFFNNLINVGYEIRKITVSVRCHPSILFYANKIFDSNVPKIFKESHVSIINNLDINFLKSLVGGIFILVETNDKGIELYENYKNNFDILFSKKLDGMPNDFDLNRDVLEELIKYYINYDNLKDRYKYPIDDLMMYLHNINEKINKSDFRIKQRSFHDFMNHSIKILNLDVSNETVNIMYEKLIDEKYKYYYYISEKNNKIMTIHSSKGLENDNVIIYLSSSFKIDNTFKNKLFVAITRAKKNVFIYYEPCFSGIEYINNLIQ